MGPRRRLRSVAWMGVTLVWLAAEGDVRADEADPIRVDFEAPNGCPRRADFFDEIRARTSRAKIVDEGEARRIRARITRGARHFRGELQILRTGGGAASTRVVSADDCAEVASALALMSALAIDPKASTQRAAELAPAPAEPDVAEPASVPAPPTPAEPPPPLAPIVALPRTEPSSPPPPTRPRDRWRVSVGLDAGVRGGTEPALVGVGQVAFRAGLQSTRLFAPAFRLGFGGAISTSVALEEGSTRFRWLAATMEGCPIAIALGSHASFRPCAVMDLGALSAAPSGYALASGSNRLYTAVGAAARLRWEAGRIFVEGAVGLHAPLERPRYYIGASNTSSESTVFEMPAIGASSTLGIGFFIFS